METPAMAAATTSDARGAGQVCDGGDDSAKAEFVLSRYSALKAHIRDEREQLANPDSDKFNSLISQVHELHHLVRRPREQVADAETLLEITSSLASIVKERCYCIDGITPSDFVSCILREFQNDGSATGIQKRKRDSVAWRDIGVAVSDAFRRCAGLRTMIGPMDAQPRTRKACVRGNRAKSGLCSYSQKLAKAAPADVSDSDMTMATMFGILKKHKRVRLENLVLNRGSFAQTIENLFALSFLARDGRVEISINENGEHMVAPRNAPSACLVASGEVAYRHFMFRFDFKDWKKMSSSVWEGEELMPNRSNKVEMISGGDPLDAVLVESQEAPKGLNAPEPQATGSNRRNGLRSFSEFRVF